MLQRGRWVGTGQTILPDGTLAGERVKARRVGFHLPATYSPWVSLATLASEWLEAQDNQQSLCDFINQRLAEPFEEQRAKTEPTLIAQKALGAPPPLIVPAWTRLLIATADTQGTCEQDGYFWYVVRAWGFDYRSQLIDYGSVSSKQELRFRCLDRPIPMEGGRLVTPQMLLVDSGGPRWNEIYQLAQADARIHPTKGASENRTWMVDERPQKAHGVVLWLISPDQSKDLLHRLIHDPDKTKWLPHRGIIDQAKPFDVAAAESDYCRQMSAESKVFDPAEGRERWVEVIKNANHFWDCEAQQCAGAWRLGAGVPEPPPPPPPPPAAPRQPDNAWLGDLRDRWSKP